MRNAIVPYLAAIQNRLAISIPKVLHEHPVKQFADFDQLFLAILLQVPHKMKSLFNEDGPGRKSWIIYEANSAKPTRVLEEQTMNTSEQNGQSLHDFLPDLVQGSRRHLLRLRKADLCVAGHKYRRSLNELLTRSEKTRWAYGVLFT